MRKYTKRPRAHKTKEHDIACWGTIRAAELRAANPAARILAERLGVTIHHAAVLTEIIGLGDWSH